MKTRSSYLIAAALTSTLLAGCATSDAPYYSQQQYPSQPYQQQYPQQQQYQQQQGYRTAYGTIDSIQVVRGSSSGSSGAGAVLGGLVGGLLGNQVGDGRGRTAATVAGAVGGAVVGNQVEKRRSETSGGDQFQINVRLDNGGYVTVLQESMNDLYVGNRVRIEGDRVYRY